MFCLLYNETTKKEIPPAKKVKRSLLSTAAVIYSQIGVIVMLELTNEVWAQIIGFMGTAFIVIGIIRLDILAREQEKSV